MRREGIVWQCLPVGEQANSQVWLEEGDFLEQSLRIRGAGGDHDQRSADLIGRVGWARCRAIFVSRGGFASGGRVKPSSQFRDRQRVRRTCVQRQSETAARARDLNELPKLLIQQRLPRWRLLVVVQSGKAQMSAGTDGQQGRSACCSVEARILSDE